MNSAGNVSKLIILLVVLALCIGALVWIAWKPNNNSGALPTNSSQCAEQLAVSLATRNNLSSDYTCSVDAFTTNTAENIRLAELRFKDDTVKIYLVDSADQIIETINHPYLVPDLSFGSDNKECGFIWTNDLSTMLYMDTEHIKRSLIKEGSEYRWQFDLTNFSGYLPEGSGRAKCLRTGTLTTNLDIEDLKIIGSPKIEIR